MFVVRYSLMSIRRDRRKGAFGRDVKDVCLARARAGPLGKQRGRRSLSGFRKTKNNYLDRAQPRRSRRIKTRQMRTCVCRKGRARRNGRRLPVTTGHYYYYRLLFTGTRRALIARLPTPLPRYW